MQYVAASRQIAALKKKTPRHAQPFSRSGGIAKVVYDTDKVDKVGITNCGEIRIVSHRSKLVSGTRWFQSSSGDNASYFTLSTIADGKKKKFGMWSENAGEERRGEGEEGRGGEDPCSMLLLQDK